jgi:hypothetical protein
VLLVLLAGCKVNYSFTGASISPDIKTVSIAYFPNYAPLAQPTLSQVFTESLKDYFLSQTSLKLTDKYGDIEFSGEIIDYKTEPMAVTQDETAAVNRLTITVKVKYRNSHDESQNFEKTFSKNETYDSSRNLNEVEPELIPQIVDQIVQDIFNASLGNW